MKKILFGATILFLAVGLNSCAKVASPETFEFDVVSSDWVENGTVGSSNHAYIVTHAMTAITADVVSNGAVLGYIKIGTQYSALPATFTYTTYSSNYNFQYETGNLYIVRKDSDLNTGIPGTITVKFVILTSKNMHLLEGVDRNNYYDVEAALK